MCTGNAGPGDRIAVVTRRPPSRSDWAEARSRAYAAGLAAALPRRSSCPLADADGHTLAEPLATLTDLPAFPTSSVDGWAVRGAGPWRVVGRVLAGGTPAAARPRTARRSRSPPARWCRTGADRRAPGRGVHPHRRRPGQRRAAAGAGVAGAGRGGARRRGAAAGRHAGRPRR